MLNSRLESCVQLIKHAGKSTGIQCVWVLSTSLSTHVRPITVPSQPNIWKHRISRQNNFSNKLKPKGKTSTTR